MITKENNELVLRLPLRQKSYDAIQEYIGDVDNLVGFSDGRDFSINHLNELGYKDDIQLGMNIISFGDREELEEECKKLGLNIWDYSRCAYCDKTIFGSFTLGDKGHMCYECQWKFEDIKKSKCCPTCGAGLAPSHKLLN